MVYRAHLAWTERVSTPERRLNVRHDHDTCDRKKAKVTIQSMLVQGQLHLAAHCSSCGTLCTIIDYTPA